ncbi:dispanin subfamily A member 2b-like [Sceloporus undulatus]|uniref:dispanin subfamily A member 2b-like n=1 Tax=Sceloporus undulatus TaxID=8520 RepID=UPI001C4DCD88|nr:dispanin subfamily A member 2b-like [Sceloporus undulatus]
MEAGGEEYRKQMGQACCPPAQASASPCSPPARSPRSLPGQPLPSPPSPPRDFVLWSLFNFGFLNCCCLGFAALVFTIKSRDRKVVGDPEGAASYGKTAKCLNITALVVSLILTVIFITVYYFVMAAFVQQFQEMMKKHQ